MKATLLAGTKYYLCDGPNESPKIIKVDIEVETAGYCEFYNYYNLNGEIVCVKPEDDLSSED
jgi:hypothetical protein